MRVTAIMTPDIATVAPETPLADVARLMTDDRISGVPVINPRQWRIAGDHHRDGDD